MAFYQLFQAPIPIPVIGKSLTKDVQSHFTRKSGRDFAQSDEQIYPQFAIKDYSPELSRLWGTAWESYEANLRDTDDDGIADTVTRYPTPQRFRFRFDVSIVAKEYNHFVSMEDFMAKTFQWTRTIVLNKAMVPVNGNGDLVTVGVPVGLEPVNVTNLDRPDGVMDTNYEIVFEAFVYLDTTDIQTVQTVNITLEVQGVTGGTGVLQATGGPVNVVVPPTGDVLIVNEVPTGAVDGSNASFTTAQSFVPESLSITINGLEQAPTMYVVTGSSSFRFTDSPQTGDLILVDYAVNH